MGIVGPIGYYENKPAHGEFNEYLLQSGGLTIRYW